MKATVADIARSCGLSTATVDRVLNNRPGASAANRQRVMEAAKQLGYLPTLDQVVLPSKPAHLEFFLPIGSNAFMADLAHHIEDYAARLPLVASCRIHNLAGISPGALQGAVENLSLKANGVGVIAVDHPRTRNILRELVEAGIRLVTLVSDVPAAPRSAYVGIDNRVAGRTAALLMGRFLGGRSGHLAMVVGSRSYRGHEEREMGFRSVLSEEFPNLTISSAVEINDEPDISYSATMRALHNEPELLGVYCVGAGRSGVAKALLESRPRKKPVFICHDLTRETRRYLVDDLADVVIDQNARLIAEQSVIRLLGSIASSAPYLTKKFIEPRLIFKENVPVQ
ncbi:LacI family DNA-binding transcriptional regulator [Mesorhizobium sp. M3A.F.Ca.ET.174.01.1.1]|uniref:LacI family DNA-binding transcriptional regulator n=1 Tax=unclassified Mesorhizobium TaxID=325217 RepID=UPI000F761EA2|nr:MULTISPECIES: LacI family DNA-binding transcriptional regulator [unclassified Mesorhizobium]AZO09305.1 LacI family DNA-binding transcriptional regulator [Mesorhizobium sp. M3A.F.Ca.ET.080.04.2.1]RWE32168.1 MAG: LacI family DNA-binding transcriptional regulator [Mesorhizobium sp.]RWF24134.1 MAG: LacI family DNA-binding transcriptional regulator [Mesorhizobium sp.]TGS82082.1 LacI family DNA-binding transcriptional regulator [Mesorhizobium sp. M3A.F.Ca.ET.175.01.1.1]TGT21944.1 LacI family DNA-